MGLDMESIRALRTYSYRCQWRGCGKRISTVRLFGTELRPCCMTHPGANDEAGGS